MDLAAALPAALAAIVLGAALLGLALLSLRWFAVRQPHAYVTSPVSIPVDTEAADAAVLVVQAGGHVVFANERARQFFDLDGQDPNLWRLAQQAKPTDTFLELLVVEGRASLNIGERQVEATSLRVPSDDQSPARFVVMLRDIGQRLDLTRADETAAQAMSVIAEVSRAISASLDLTQTFDAILSNVGRAFQYNIAEITLWDQAAEVLRPVRYAGDRAYERELVQSGGAYYKPDEGFSGWIAKHRQPLLISNVESFTQVRPKLERADFPFRSYVGVPLLTGQAEHAHQFVGTLELISYKLDAYQPNDLLLLNAIAGQAAIAIQNAQLYAEQQKRVAELSGLADLTRAIEVTSDPRELYGRLTADIARLMGAQMVGFLLHHPAENALVGQAPFHGVPDIVVDIYRIPLQPGTTAERLWREHESWVSNDLPNDPIVDELGLRQLAEMAGVKNSMLAPIVMGGRRLGVLQVSNKMNGGPFTDQDVRLLSIFAGQAAAILDNARLVREARERAEQEEMLRQIAATAAASTELDLILRTAMQQTASLLRCDVGLIALLDEARGELAPHTASLHGGSAEQAERARLRTDDPLFAFSVTRLRRPFLSNQVQRDRRISGIYQAIVEHFEMGSMMDVPLVIGDRSIGEMIVGTRRENAFLRNELQLLATVASELASAIERARLYAATDQDLQRRVEQLTALTRVGRELNQTLELERILRLVHDEARHAAHAACGTIVLLDANAPPGTVALRIGEEDLGQSLTPLEMEAAASREARVRRVTALPPDSPLAAHAEVRSAMVVPILVGGTVVGLIHLHNDRPEGFDDSAEETTLALAAQAAIAVGNAQRYEEQLKRGELLRRRADQLAELFQVSRTVRSDQPLAANLEAIAYGLQEAVGFNVVLISVLDPQTRRLKRTAAAGIPLATFDQIQKVEQPWDNFVDLLRDEYLISQSYFLPYEKTAEATAALDTVSVVKTVPANLPPNGWHPDDMLIVPLHGSGQEPVGVLTVDDPRDGLRPDRSTVEIIEIFANQAALAIENAWLYQAAERRAARLLALHRVIEYASRVTDRAQVWQTVATSLVDEMGLDVCLVAIQEGESFTVRGQAGELRPEIDFGSLFAAAGRTSTEAESGEPMLAFNTKESLWSQNPLVLATGVTSFISAPILSQGQLAGTLFAGSRRTPTPFAQEDVELFIILTNQLGGWLENAQLYAETQRRLFEQTLLYECGRDLALARDTQAAITAVIEHMVRWLQATALCFYTYDEAADTIRTDYEYWTPQATERERVSALGEVLSLADFPRLATALHKRVPQILRRSDPALSQAEHDMLIQWDGQTLVAVPMIVHDRALGYFEIWDSRVEREYAEEDVRLLLALAGQAGVFYEAVRLEATMRERAAQLEALAEVSRTITSTLRPEDVVQTVLGDLKDVVPYDSVTLWLRDGQQLRVAAAQGFENDAERLGLTVDIADSALFAEMARTRDAILVPDVRVDARFPAGSLQPTHSWLGAPLVSKGQIIGALALDKLEAHAYSRQAAQGLMAFASQAAVALDNARLFEESKRRTLELDERSQRLALLNRVSAQLGSILDVNHILQITLSEMTSALNVERAAAVLFDQSGQATLTAQMPETFASTFDPQNPALKRVRESLAPLAIEDVAQEASLAPVREALLERGVKSLLVIPLVAAGNLIAAIQFEVTAATRHFSPSEIELAQTLANQAAVAVQNARLYDETQTRLAELSTLNQISRAISFSLDLEQVYATVGEQVTLVLGVDTIYLALYDEARHQLSFPLFLERGQPVELSPREPAGLSLHIIRTRSPLLLRGDDVRSRLEELGALSVGAGSAKSYLGVPLLIGERVIGVLAVQDLERTSTFTYEHVRILSTIAAQVAVAVENARLYHEIAARAGELAQRTERLAFLNRLSATLSASLDPETVLKRASEEVTHLFQVDHSGVLLFDEAGQFGTVEAEYPEHGVIGTRLSLQGDPLEEELLAHRAPVVVEDTATDPRLSPDLRQNFARLGIQSILIAPFISQGRAIGSISLDAISEPHHFRRDEIELFQTIAAQIAVAVTNARFAQELEERVALRTHELNRERERVETLLQITTELSSSLDLDLVLTRALQLVTEAVSAPQGSIFLVDLESDQLIYRAALGRPRPLPPGGEVAPFKRGEGLVGWVIKNRQAVVIGDLDTDPRWKQFPEHAGAHKSALAVPLMANEDALGAMILLSPYQHAFDDEQLRLVVAAANQVGAAINNAELYRLIRDQAERLGGMLRGQQVEATKSRAILEGIADGVFVTDAAGQVILFNAACERVLGLRRDEVIGRAVTEFVGIYGPAGTAWLDAINRWTLDPSSYRPGEFFAERLELEDQRVILVHLAPVTTGEEYLGSVSVIRDITREVEVDRLKSEFVTNVSHELRTPMTSIKGYADILLMGAAGPVNSEQAKFLEVIKGNADRLSMLVNDLLDISRIESGRVELVLRPIHLREVFTQVADTLKGRMDEENKPMTVLTEVPADLPPVWGDRERVTQVIMNLGDNAFNYTHAGGTITLRAKLGAKRNEVQVEVADTGVGIASEDQPRLFDRFYRGEDALVLATAGTGLGLSIARQLLEMHGGRLWLASSEVGQGSTFALTLPLAPGEALQASPQHGD